MRKGENNYHRTDRVNNERKTKMKLTADDVELIRDAALIMSNLRNNGLKAIIALITNAEKDGIGVGMFPYIAEHNGKTANRSVLVACRRVRKGHEWLCARISDAKMVEMTEEEFKVATAKMVQALVEATETMGEATTVPELIEDKNSEALAKIILAIASKVADKMEEAAKDSSIDLGKDRGDSFGA
jgi:hypothetical protein